MDPLAITGVGVVSPVGIGHDEFFAAQQDVKAAKERAFANDSLVLPRELFPDARVAETRNFDATKFLGDKGLRNFDRLTKMMIVAGKLALEDAGIKKNGEFISLKPEQVGIISSTAYGSLEAITELNLVAEKEDPRYINPARFPNTVINAAAGYVSIWEDLRAPNVTIVDGNCGALDAILSCETHLAHERADAFLIGGGEALSEPLYRAFRMLGVVCEGDEPWEPGDSHTNGMRLGEGAAYLCVERAHEAKARGARLRGLLLGYGTAFDAPHSEAVLVHPSIDSVTRAVRAAVKDAGLSPNDIDAVVASASGIERFDAAELMGLSRGLREDVLIASPKSILGETFGAHGALGMACGLAWLEGVAPAPILSGRARDKIEHVVVTTTGYYGNVSAAVLGRAA